jgi:hypothetical protein
MKDRLSYIYNYLLDLLEDTNRRLIVYKQRKRIENLFSIDFLVEFAMSISVIFIVKTKFYLIIHNVLPIREN